MRPSGLRGLPALELPAPLCSADCVPGPGPGSPAGSPRPRWPSPGAPYLQRGQGEPCTCLSAAASPSRILASHPTFTPTRGQYPWLERPRPWLDRQHGPGFLPPSLPAAPPPPYLWPLNLCERPALIYLQVLISFRLIEVQARRASLFDPQIGYESQSNRLISAHGFYPG